MTKPLKTMDFSIDCETLDTRYSAAILSFAFVQFDLETGALGAEFYREIDLMSAIKSGTISADTLNWWVGQGEHAKRVFAPKGKTPLSVALDELHQWLLVDLRPKNPTAPVRIWAYGPSSDITWLEHAYINGGVGQVPPWTHREVRDMRTIIDRAGFWPDNWPIKRDETQKHNALVDARYQAQTIALAWQMTDPVFWQLGKKAEQGAMRATPKNETTKPIAASKKTDVPAIDMTDEEL